LTLFSDLCVGKQHIHSGSFHIFWSCFLMFWLKRNSHAPLA